MSQRDELDKMSVSELWIIMETTKSRGDLMRRLGRTESAEALYNLGVIASAALGDKIDAMAREP